MKFCSFFGINNYLFIIYNYKNLITNLIFNLYEILYFYLRNVFSRFRVIFKGPVQTSAPIPISLCLKSGDKKFTVRTRQKVLVI